MAINFEEHCNELCGGMVALAAAESVNAVLSVQAAYRGLVIGKARQMRAEELLKALNAQLELLCGKAGDDAMELKLRWAMAAVNTVGCDTILVVETECAKRVHRPCRVLSI